jgi:hypothetical protein
VCCKGRSSQYHLAHEGKMSVLVTKGRVDLLKASLLILVQLGNAICCKCILCFKVIHLLHNKVIAQDPPPVLHNLRRAVPVMKPPPRVREKFVNKVQAIVLHLCIRWIFPACC